MLRRTARFHVLLLTWHVTLTFNTSGLLLASTPAYFKMVRNFTANAVSLQSTDAILERDFNKGEEYIIEESFSSSGEQSFTTIRPLALHCAVLKRGKTSHACTGY
ncbi:hypothetical protein MJ588_24725 [Klebsiella pneumoniae]|nr:hypothetical protein MJ588_24725 [Klebsiella pneumoniae]